MTMRPDWQEKLIDESMAGYLERRSHEHLCSGTDGESTMCIFNWEDKHVVYGPCEDSHCGGACMKSHDCTCECHKENK